MSYTMDGRCFVEKQVEPYVQYWLSERERALLSTFPATNGRGVDDAISAYFRLTGEDDEPHRRASLRRKIMDMKQAGILAGRDDDTSRYDVRMAADYLEHRKIPRQISDFIIKNGQITKESPVLDLAGGPGSLAIPMAHASNAVSMIELSRGFVAAAEAEARRSHIALRTIHESCNRLPHHPDTYDVVTVCQALHWLDDIAICRGICRTLRDGGSFFVVHSALHLRDDHPLSFVLGDQTPLGNKVKSPFPIQVAALNRRLTLLFDALDAPDVERIDSAQVWRDQAGKQISRIVPVGGALFCEKRIIDQGFARAFLSPQHISRMQTSPKTFWLDVEQRCKAAGPDNILGYQDWAILHFRRGGPAWDATKIINLPVTMIAGQSDTPMPISL